MCAEMLDFLEREIPRVTTGQVSLSHFEPSTYAAARKINKEEGKGGIVLVLNQILLCACVYIHAFGGGGTFFGNTVGAERQTWDGAFEAGEGCFIFAWGLTGNCKIAWIPDTQLSG